jgi:hypothetical protein
MHELCPSFFVLKFVSIITFDNVGQLPELSGDINMKEEKSV